MITSFWKWLEFLRAILHMTALLALLALMLVINPCASSFRMSPASIIWLPWELMSGVIFSPYLN